MSSLVIKDNVFRMTRLGWYQCKAISIMDAEVAFVGATASLVAPWEDASRMNKFRGSALIYLYGKTLPKGAAVECAKCAHTQTEGCIMFRNPLSGCTSCIECHLGVVGGAWADVEATDAKCNGGPCLGCSVLTDEDDDADALFKLAKEGATIMHAQATSADEFAAMFYGERKDKKDKEVVGAASAMEALVAGVDVVVKRQLHPPVDWLGNASLSRDAKFDLVLKAAHGKHKYGPEPEPPAAAAAAAAAVVIDLTQDEPEPAAPPAPSRKRTRTKFDQVGGLLFDQQASWTVSRAQLGREALAGAGTGHFLLEGKLNKKRTMRP